LLIFFAFALVFSFVAGLTACNDKDEAQSEDTAEESVEGDELSEYPVTIYGITVNSRPSRVVSLSPSLTEKLYDIGLDESLVGVSDYCDYPPHAASFTKCGTGQIPNIDRILVLKPHVVLAQAPLSEEDARLLSDEGVDIIIIPPAKTVREWKESYVSLARLLEGEHVGAAVGQGFTGTLQSRLDELRKNFGPYADEHGRKKVLYLLMLDFTVATGDTLENELMELIGLDNIAGGQNGWQYPEELASGESRADFEAINLIFMDENFVTITDLEQSSFYRGLQATLQDWFVYIDSIVLERQSLRALGIIERMGRAAYPDAIPEIPFVEDDDGEDDSGEEDGED